MAHVMGEQYNLMVETLCEFIMDHSQIDDDFKRQLTDDSDATTAIINHEKVPTLLVQMALDGNYLTFAADELEVLIEEIALDPFKEYDEQDE